MAIFRAKFEYKPNSYDETKHVIFKRFYGTATVLELNVRFEER